MQSFELTAFEFLEKSLTCLISTIGNLLKEQLFQFLLRIHRSYAVQKHLIQKITTTAAFVNNIEFPIGRSYMDMMRSFK